MKLRKEKILSYKGLINLDIPCLKSRHIQIVNIKMDGDAPKEYINAYFFQEGKRTIHRCNNWDGYICKVGHKHYPIESTTEYLINRIGESLGLSINHSKLLLANGQIRFLAKDFLKKGEKLIHGIEIISEYLEDKEFVNEINENRKERRHFFTFDLLEESIIDIYKQNSNIILQSLIKMIVFDAVTGNNDRHFYNWGLIGNSNRIKNKQPVFSPIYDSSRGLYWNLSEDNINQILIDENKINHYIINSMPRISIPNNPKANHFELLKYIKEKKKNYLEIITSLITKEKEDKIVKLIDVELAKLLSGNRKKLIVLTLQKRFDKLRELI